MSNSDFISPAQHEQQEVLFDSGGTCDCYRLVKDNRVYCVKRPKKDMRSSEAYMSLFRKEFELGIDLEHPNIVRYFVYDEDEQGPFILMDYIDGDSLEAFVAQHPDYFKDKGHRKQFCDELFSALDYLHDKKMLHLDLKPSNILITNKGHHVKLIDLGFGWSESYLHDLGFTRDYCAPEQQTAETELFGPATDIYALGKILQRFGLAKDAVIQGCLKENPQERFQSIDALKKALRPKRWPLLVLAALFVGLLCWTLPTTIRQGGTVSVPHDTIIIMQVDTVFMPEPQPELTLEDSLALFKEELQNALAPTFSYWYMMIDNMFENQPNLPKEVHLETSKFYIDKGISVSQGIIKEKINTMQLSKTAKPHYEKAAQEVVDYYLKDYRKLKKKLEKELAVL